MSYSVSRNPEGRRPSYEAKKSRVNLSLTEASIYGLDILAQEFNLSRSEFVERIGRGLIPIAITPQMLSVKVDERNDDAVAV